MHLEDLHTFIEVADTGGVAPGARRLGIAKSIVSRRLARLEEALGVQLLSRTTRGSVLTEEGVTLREHARRVIVELDAVQETFSPRGEVRGLLRISAPLSFGASQLAPVFAELAKRHPSLQMDTSYSDRVVDLAGEGFDCAVRLGFLSDSSLIARRICTFRGRLVASPGYLETHGIPQTIEDLSSHQAVAKKGETWPLTKGGNTVIVRPRGRFIADSGEAILAGALAGLGVAALPDFLIESHILAGNLTPLLPEYPASEAGIYVVGAPGAFSSRKIRALIEILIENFGD